MSEYNDKPNLPELKVDRTKIKVFENFDDSEDIEFWRNTTYEQRLEHVYRLRWMAYGNKIRGRIQRVLEVVESE